MRPLALASPPSLLPPSLPPSLLSGLSPSLSPSIPAFLSPFLFALLGYKVIKKHPPCGLLIMTQCHRCRDKSY